MHKINKVFFYMVFTLSLILSSSCHGETEDKLYVPCPSFTKGTTREIRAVTNGSVSIMKETVTFSEGKDYVVSGTMKTHGFEMKTLFNFKKKGQTVYLSKYKTNVIENTSMPTHVQTPNEPYCGMIPAQYQYTEKGAYGIEIKYTVEIGALKNESIRYKDKEYNAIVIQKRKNMRVTEGIDRSNSITDISYYVEGIGLIKSKAKTISYTPNIPISEVDTEYMEQLADNINAESIEQKLKEFRTRSNHSENKIKYIKNETQMTTFLLDYKNVEIQP